MIKIQNNEIEVLDPKMQGEGAEAKNLSLIHISEPTRH